MIETVVSAQLPVGEHLLIQKNCITGKEPSEKRAVIVTGTHGDELEGQYVCFLLSQILEQNTDKLAGTVEIYPALNPLGIDTMTRGIPGFDLDMNRIFPGAKDGSMAEYVARHIIDDIAGADLCIDIHSSNLFLREIPQVRLNEEWAEQLIPLAMQLNVDFVWVHQSATVLKSTLAHSLNSIKVPTLVVEMGVGIRITRDYGQQLVDGILNLLAHMGIWKGDTQLTHTPIVCSRDNEVDYLHAEAPGVFVPAAEHTGRVERGSVIGNILNPLENRVVQEVTAPRDGVIFTLREYPVVSPGSLIARVYHPKENTV